MKKQRAIELAGSVKALAEIFDGITPSAISQWGEDLPASRMWELRVKRPDWFLLPEPAPQAPEPGAREDSWPA